MYVKRVAVQDFRNYEYGEVDFINGTNVICGPNARGKTNILESIFLFATSKSHRGARESDLIRKEAEFAKIKISFFARGRENVGEININKKKQFRINKVPIVKTSDLMGCLNVVMFCPEDLRVIKGAPRERRRFLDIGISQIRSGYFHKLIEYNKILDQRNALLRTGMEDTWVWDEQFAKTGARVAWYRKNYILELEKYAKEHMKNIGNEEISIKYINEKETEEDYRLDILAGLEKNKEREKRWKQTLYGPHRDDFIIEINKLDIRHFASQGQIRTTVIALKLAEADIIKKETGETPILLLDDALSELDEERQKYILKKFGGAQVIITCTNAEKFEGVRVIKVDDIRRVGVSCIYT